VDDATKATFLRAAEGWICQEYHWHIRYLAVFSEGKWHVWEAQLDLNPLPAGEDNSFKTRVGSLLIGQVQSPIESKERALETLRNACLGQVQVDGVDLTLPMPGGVHFYSDMYQRERWFFSLHLQIGANYAENFSSSELFEMDNALRLTSPPFDGLIDAANWLGLSTPAAGTNSRITIRVSPPVDLLLEKCSLLNDKLSIKAISHSGLDVSQVGLAIRTVPGKGLEARTQIADTIIWSEPESSTREGDAEIQLENADAVLVMLSVGGATVRRHWLIDPSKARNNRYLAVGQFDKDLKMVRQAALESTDSNKFELAVASLLFMLGFNPAVQLETDSPDLIVSTPGGRLVVVECTTRIADFHAKVGKIVDRRGALTKSLQASGHVANIAAVLICRLPSDQIAADLDDLKSRGVILLAGEDISSALDRVRFPNDPDKMLQDAEAGLAG